MDRQYAASAIETAERAKTFAVIKRSVIIDGRKTSVSLEDAFWDGLKEIALRQGISLSVLIARIHAGRSTANLSSAIRLFVFDHFRSRAITHLLIGSRQQQRSTRPSSPQGSVQALTL
jgi:predicted DNA-binding ribbon-helix-helix protein